MSLRSGSIRLPRIRFTVRRLMVGIAAVAVSCYIYAGIWHFFSYQSNGEREAFDRNEAAKLEAENESDAKFYRREAEALARENRREHRPAILTAACILIFGVLAGGIHLATRWQYPTWVQHQRRLMVGLVDACSSVAAVSLGGLVIGGIFFLLTILCLYNISFMIRYYYSY